MTQATAALHQAVAIQHRMDRAFGRNSHSGEPPDEALPDFTSTPAGVLALDVQNVVFNLKRKLTAKAIGSATPVRQSLDPAFLINDRRSCSRSCGRSRTLCRVPPSARRLAG